MIIQLIKFSFVGLLATAIHALIFYLVVNVLMLHGQLANLCGFLVAVVVSYFGQRHWTFASTSINDTAGVKVKYFATACLSLILNAFWVWVVEVLLKVNANVAVLFILFVTPLVTFVALKLWVFKE